MKETNEKPKPPLVKAEVIDNMVALNVGESGPDGRRIENVYKPFFKGAIVEVDPITFRNLERDGRLKAATDSDAGVVPEKKRKRRLRDVSASLDMTK